MRGLSWMVVFKRKQIVILSLVLMIVVAGYLNYSYKNGSVSVNGKDSGKLGEAVYVDNADGVDNTDLAGDVQVDSKISKTEEASSASKQVNDYFAQAKMDKEEARGINKDSLKEITEDKNASKDAKAKAYDQMMKVIGNSEKEMKVELLIKEKGFNDVIALFGDDGSLDIIIKSPNLTSAQTAQITDIVSRQANVEISNMHIKNVF
jgi:stage III sporulation protein AH